jgi:dsRNA-specific ribonuclease
VVPKKFCIKRKMSTLPPPTLPPLPPVQSEAVLAIFVHSSLKSTVPNDKFGDADRLAFIGRQALTMAVAEVLFEKTPMMSAVDLEV